MAQILWFEQYQPADAPELGGKNASLGTLLGAGLPVPPGFAVSAECYRKALADGGLSGEIDALIAAVDPRDTASVAAANAGYAFYVPSTFSQAYTGITYVNAGTLAIGSGGSALGSIQIPGDMVINNGGTVTMNQNQTVYATFVPSGE